MPIKYYRTKATRGIPVKIDYVCEFCDHAESDSDQVVDVEGYSRPSAFKRITRRSQTEAYLHLETETERMLYDIKNKNYQNLGLTCKCHHCQKRQSWSSFIKSYDILVLLFVLGVAGLVITVPRMLIALFTDLTVSPLVLLASLLLALPQTVVYILNHKNRQRIMSLDEKYLPKITFYAEDVVRKAEKVDRDENKSAVEREYLNVFEQERFDAKRQAEPGEWKCPSCWRMNKNSVDICDCGTERPDK